MSNISSNSKINKEPTAMTSGVDHLVIYTEIVPYEIAVAAVICELLTEAENGDKRKGGKTRIWLKRRKEKGTSAISSLRTNLSIFQWHPQSISSSLFYLLDKL